MTKNLNVLLVEAPTNKLVFRGKNPFNGSLLDSINVGPVDTNLSKPTAGVIASALFSQLPEFGYEPKISFFDGKTLPREIFGRGGSMGKYLEHKKDVPYAGGIMGIYRLGVNLSSIRDILVDFPMMGITSNFTFESARVIECIAAYRLANPQGKVIVGGRDATFRPRFYLNSGADAVVLGEGEQIAGKLFHYLNTGKRIDFENIAFREGTCCYGLEQKPRRSPINSIPMPHFFTPEENLRADLPGWLHTYYSESQDGPLPKGAGSPVYHTFTSRGCVFDCSFCTTAGMSYDPMLPGNTRALLEHLKRSGVSTLISAEDAFMERIKFSREGRNGRTELLETMRIINDLRFPIEWANGINFNLFYDKKRGEVDLELLDAVFGSHFDNEGNFSGTYRALIPVERPGGDVRLRKLAMHDAQLAVVSEIARRHKTPSFGVTYIIRPEDTELHIEKAVAKLTEFQEVISEASEGKSRSRLGIFCLMPHPGTKDSNLEKLNAFPLEEYPELRHYFAPVLDGTSMGGLSYERLFWKMLELKQVLDPVSYASWLEGGNYAH